jgi:hypothetical protein
MSNTVFTEAIIIAGEKIENLPRLIEVLYEQVNKLPLSDATRRDLVKIMICDMLQKEPQILETYLQQSK